MTVSQHRCNRIGMAAESICLCVVLFAPACLFDLDPAREGFPCNPEHSCEHGLVCIDGVCVLDPCLEVACDDGEICLNGTCFVQSCEDRACPDGFICVDGDCVTTTCADVSCEPDHACADGRCYATDCAGIDCGAGVCIDGECMPRSCVGVKCPDGEACALGECHPVDCAVECAPGEVCIGGECTDASCVGVVCEDGLTCEAGACVEPLACEPGFGEHEDYPDECHDELEVLCDPEGAQPPDNASIDDDELVTIAWDDEDGWSRPAPCGWSCDPGYEREGNVCVEVSCDIALLFPRRTWPNSPLDIDLEILGADFDAGAQVLWDAGGDEVVLTPAVETGRLIVTLPHDLFVAPPGEVVVAVEQHGARCATAVFVLGGVMPDTGQQRCYDESGAIPCPTAGQPFFGQDAQFGWDPHVDEAERFERYESVPTEPLVFDRITRLFWQGCAAELGGGECDVGSASWINWEDSLGYCDGLDWGGHQDWRLPAVTELSSIVDRGRWSPSINDDIFPGTIADYHWTSSSRANVPIHGWSVSFFGYKYHFHKDSGFLARCARGDAAVTMPESTTAAFFRSLGAAEEPVVRDVDTGLMWQGCSAEQAGNDCGLGDAATMIWQDALSYCHNLEWAGHTDWRLPSVNELESTVDHGFVDPAVGPTVFPGTISAWYYSSSSDAHDPTKAWSICFHHGYIHAQEKSDEQNVRCVRGGPGA